MRGVCMDNNTDLGITMYILEEMKSEILLASLLIMLFVFDRESAIDFSKILIIFLLSSKIIKNDFSHLIFKKLNKEGNNRIYEYVFSSIFTIFVFVIIEFLLNKMFFYTLFAFICLLVFTGGVLYIITRREKHQITKGEN